MSALRNRWQQAGQAALLAGGVAQASAWLWYAAVIWRQEGLFSRIGLDFGFYWATARAYALEGPRALFDLAAIARAGEPLAAFYATPSGAPLNVAPPVYPPLFFALLVPLTGLPPLLGLALWTGTSLLAAAAALWGACRLPCRPFSRHGERPLGWGAMIAALSFGPLALGLLLGQVEGLMLYALYRTYRAMVDQRELAAGLWLGTLFLKPQYAAFLALVLLFNRRWYAVAGMALTGGLVATLSLVAVGGDVPSYWRALAQALAFRPPPEAAAHAPGDMISWRGLIYTLLPGVTPLQGAALTLALSAATVATLPLVWRGQWRPQDPAFPRRVLATMLVTMLASFHNHLHGAALVLVPALVAACTGLGNRVLGAILLLSLFLPAALYLLADDLALTAQATGALALASLVSTVWLEVRHARRSVASQTTERSPAVSAPASQAPNLVRAGKGSARRVQSAAI